MILNRMGGAETIQLFVIFEILIGIFVAVSLIYIATNPSVVSDTEKFLVEKELNMIYPTIFATGMGEEIKLYYELPRGYEVEFKEGKFSLKKTGFAKMQVIFENDGSGNTNIAILPV